MSDIITICVFISSILFSLSQSYIVYNVKINEKLGLKYTSSFSIISCLIYQLIWFNYYLKNDDSICWCYFVGSLFSFIWISIYLFFYSKENQEKKNLYFFLYIFIIIDLIFEICFVENDILDNDKDTGKTVIDIISSIFNILMYIIPGTNIFEIFKELNNRYILFPISIIAFFNSLIWLFYGIIKNKNVYLYTNINGICICIIQIIIYFLLRKNIGESKINNELLISDTDSTSTKKKKGKKKKKSMDKQEQNNNTNDILTII